MILLINGLNYVCENSRQWYDDLMEEQQDTNEQEKALNNVINTLKDSDVNFKQHCKLKPESINSEFVKELQVCVYVNDHVLVHSYITCIHCT